MKRQGIGLRDARDITWIATPLLGTTCDLIHSRSSRHIKRGRLILKSNWQCLSLPTFHHKELHKLTLEVVQKSDPEGIREILMESFPEEVSFRVRLSPIPHRPRYPAATSMRLRPKISFWAGSSIAKIVSSPSASRRPARSTASDRTRTSWRSRYPSPSAIHSRAAIVGNPRHCDPTPRCELQRSDTARWRSPPSESLSPR